MKLLVILAVIFPAELPQTDPVALRTFDSVRSCVAALPAARQQAKPFIDADRIGGREAVLVCLSVHTGEEV